MESWSEEDVYQWVAREFDEATAKDFEGLPSHYTPAKYRVFPLRNTILSEILA